MELYYLNVKTENKTLIESNRFIEICTELEDVYCGKHYFINLHTSPYKVGFDYVCIRLINTYTYVVTPLTLLDEDTLVKVPLDYSILVQFNERILKELSKAEFYTDSFKQDEKLTVELLLRFFFHPIPKNIGQNALREKYCIIQPNTYMK